MSAQKSTFEHNGHLGGDPEITTVGDGRAKLTMSVGATNSYKVDGEWKERQPTWLRIVVFGKKAEELFSQLKKGTRVDVKGRIANNDYTDANGAKHYGFDFVASSVKVTEKTESE